MGINRVCTKKTLTNIIFELLLLTAGALIFALSFPSFISRWGLAPLAFIAIIPVFIVVHRVGYLKSFIYGAFFGYVSYSIVNYWLATFDPMAFIVVPLIYASYFLILFPLLKLADQLFPRKGFILQLFIWLAYEFLRTKAFLGYSYGVIGYTQYNFLSLIGISDITGVAGVTLIVIFPSIIIGNALKDGIRSFKENLKLWIKPSVIWLILFVCFNIYGSVSKVDYSDSPTWKTALIQHNVNSWRSGITVNEEALDIIISLSEMALEENPDTIIWSETAIVPPIEYIMKNRTNRRKVELIQNIYDFMERTEIPLILGNNDWIGTADKHLNYNSVLHFQNGELQNTYHKTHLVPFSEHFPYERIFPRLYEYIISLKVSFYDQGDEYIIFEQNGFKLAPLICFEDTFGYLSREFVLNGADVLVNLTNDSWSSEYASNVQHMAIAVFRTVENRRSMVRSTNAGFTTVIDPNGKRIGALEPFTEDFLVTDTPVYNNRTTIYTRFGNWLDYVSILIAILGILSGVYIKYKHNR